MNHRIRYRACVLLLWAAIVPAAAAAGDWRGEERMIEGTPHVLNPSQPASEPQTHSPQELWRVTGGDESEGGLLGQVTGVQVDAAGNTYLLDRTFSTIRIYAPDGRLLRTIGREGDGPGEWRNGMGLLCFPDGKVGVVRHMPSRIVLLDGEGNPAGEIAPPGQGERGMGVIQKAECAGDVLVLSATCPVLRDDAVFITQTLGGFDLRGNPRATYLKETRRNEGPRIDIRMNDARSFSSFWALGQDERLFVAPRFDDYRIDVYASDGALERVIEREYRSLKRTDEELGELEEQATRMSAMSGIEEKVEPYDRDILRLLPRPGGELWVWSSEGKQGCPAGSVGTFDVFDREGRYLHRLDLKVDYDAQRDLFILAGDRLFVLKEARMAPTSINRGSEGGGPTMVMVGMGRGAQSAEPGGEPSDFSVICYALPG